MPIAAGVLVSLTATMIGCAGGSGPTSPSATQTTFEIYGIEVAYEEDLAAGLPQDVKDAGVLVFTTDALAPPRTSTDENGDIVGVIPDLLDAIGATLGVEIDLQKGSFDGEVPGVQSGRFDATTGTGDFPTRREVLDMVDYYRAGVTELVPAGNPKNVTDHMSQCGLRVGAIKGTTEESLVQEMSDECVAAGNEAVDVQTFNNVILSVPLEADRIDVAWTNSSTGFELAKTQPERFELVNATFMAYLAFGVKKDRPELRDTLQATVQHLMDIGVYEAIFTNWDQEDLMMDYISINSDNRDS